MQDWQFAQQLKLVGEVALLHGSDEWIFVASDRKTAVQRCAARFESLTGPTVVGDEG